MIEQYFRAGVRLLWNKPPDAPGAQDGSIVANVGLMTPLTYDGLDGRPAAVDPLLQVVQAGTVLGLVMGGNIPATWLDYAPGRTARLPVGANDMLSGYMSGCLIARGTFAGAMSVFHVGTIDGNLTVNRTVKQAFAQALPADATGFFPHAAWPDGEITVLQNRLGGALVAQPRIVALVTAAGAFHSVLLFNVSDNNQWYNAAGVRYWCVGGIKAVPAVNRIKLMASLLA